MMVVSEKRKESRMMRSWKSSARLWKEHSGKDIYYYQEGWEINNNGEGNTNRWVWRKIE